VRPDLAILGLWIAFAGSHVALSSLRLRPRIVRAIGEPAFLGLYSLVAFAFFVPLVWIYYANLHAGPWLWTFGRGAVQTWIVEIGMAAALVLVVAGNVTPSPASIAATAAGAPAPVEPRGAFRITRHPLIMGIGLFGLLHLVPNASTADVAFFGGFAAFALVGCWHQDQRKLQTNPGYRAFYERTPFLPFTGRDSLRGVLELSPVALVVGIGLTLAIRWAHRFWQ
jgi:uncharacterized membrane protein